MMILTVAPSDPVLGELIASMNFVGSGMGMKNTERALSLLTRSVQRAWQDAVGSNHRIESKKTAPFEHVVYSRDPVVHWLEYGLKSFDMKQTHTKGPKSRVVKPRKRGNKVITQWTARRKDGSSYLVHAGDPYLIIPFRHRAKQMKTIKSDSLKSAYSMVQSQMRKEDFKRSTVTKSPEQSSVSTPNAMGDMVKRAEYDWGTRMSFPDEPEYDNLQGMVAMGDPGQSSFLSFRVVSVNSGESSWIHPGITARHYAQNILERGQETMQTVIESAIGKDLGI